MKLSNRLETVFLITLFVVSFVLRFPQLGYSQFYGDETKTLYWNKTIPAVEFFLDQRKGPVQFFVVWVVEKATGGFTETAVRFPFALAGFGSVFVLYFLVKKLFDFKAAFLSAFIFSLNGFYIAFARTAQYQIFLVLFGLLALLFAVQKRWLFSALTLALAFLSHYDAVFFAIPVFFVIAKDLRTKSVSFKKILAQFALPLLVIVGSFYIPYVVKGYAAVNTFGYLDKRVDGKDYVPNNSLYTAKVYNPGFIAFIPLLFFLFGLAGKLDWRKVLLISWFLVSFGVFEFVFANPGTHVHTYYIPLFILSALGIVEVFKKSYFALLGLLFFMQFAVAFSVFIPFVRLGYPWKENALNLRMPDKRYHLFLYGFPYNRGWDQVKKYLVTQKGVRNYYTNDNAAIAAYYLKEYDSTPPGNNYSPQYYIDVVNNQEFKTAEVDLVNQYVLEKAFFVNGELVSSVYKRTVTE